MTKLDEMELQAWLKGGDHRAVVSAGILRRRRARAEAASHYRATNHRPERCPCGRPHLELVPLERIPIKEPA